jgi:hypothetical protein
VLEDRTMRFLMSFFRDQSGRPLIRRMNAKKARMNRRLIPKFVAYSLVMALVFA